LDSTSKFVGEYYEVTGTDVIKYVGGIFEVKGTSVTKYYLAGIIQKAIKIKGFLNYSPQVHWRLD